MRRLSSAAQRLLAFDQQVDWICVATLWLVVGIPCLWVQREDVVRLWEYFTWTSLRLMLFSYRNWAGAGILLCVGATLTVLISQSRHELFGLFPFECRLLEKRVERIRGRGVSHPLWAKLKLDQEPQKLLR